MLQKRYRVLGYFILIFVLICYIPPLTIQAAKSDTKGIDVSRYNGDVDWGQVALSGIDFAMIKTGDGKDTGNHAVDIDPQFENNYQGAGEAGIKRGVYHTCSTKTVASARLEAEYCLSILDGRKLEYPVAYDIELPGTFSTGKENVTAIAVAFCETIKKAGYTPMIYTTAHAFNTYFDYEKIKGYQIWIAHYDVPAPDFNHPYHIWQYTDKGKVDGANNHYGYCDLNYAFSSIPSTRLTLNRSSITLGQGENFQLTTKLLPLSTTDKLSYSTSNSAVAAVSKNGKIVTKKTGTAVITVESTSGLKASCKISVKKAPASVRFSTASKTVKRNQLTALKVVLPKNTASQSLTFTSSNKNIVAVNAAGQIKGKKKGTATITVKTFNKKTGTIKITVK